VLWCWQEISFFCKSPTEPWFVELGYSCDVRTTAYDHWSIPATQTYTGPGPRAQININMETWRICPACQSMSRLMTSQKEPLSRFKAYLTTLCRSNLIYTYLSVMVFFVQEKPQSCMSKSQCSFSILKGRLSQRATLGNYGNMSSLEFRPTASSSWICATRHALINNLLRSWFD
jgi:hypothetical protein